MIRFLVKGLFRDRNRSLFPMVIITIGVAISVFMHCFISGMADETIRSNARMETGHLKVLTNGYNSLSGQFANDLAVRGAAGLVERLKAEYPDVRWMPRIKFGGLLDLPDENGETRSQGPAFGIALDLVEKRYPDLQFIGLEEALVSGRLPENPGEIVMSDKFASNLGASL
ncbi:MAG TPA: hypothetical protein VLA34_05125, partial [Candidatus Krumholzibacterium sp.]|nr:hypothetical protein [Candidatus Krumholzibacterium sp.]